VTLEREKYFTYQTLSSLATLTLMLQILIINYKNQKIIVTTTIIKEKETTPAVVIDSMKGMCHMQMGSYQNREEAFWYFN